AKRQLVNVLKNERKFAEAVALLKELVVAEPANERQYNTEIAELELQLYHDDDAIAYAQKALEKSPNDPQALVRLADIYAKRNDDEKAIASYRRVLDLDPRNFQVRFALAKIYLRDGHHRDAAQLYREVVKRATDDEVVRTAARKAMDLEEYLQTLGDLEQDLSPLAFAATGKSTYRRILVEIYDRSVPALVHRARNGDAAAEKELQRIGEHGLKPLLEALEDASDLDQLRAAVRVLGYLGNKAAAAPLVKLAASPPVAAGVGGKPDPGQSPAIDIDTRAEAPAAARPLPAPAPTAAHRPRAQQAPRQRRGRVARARRLVARAVQEPARHRPAPRRARRRQGIGARPRLPRARSHRRAARPRQGPRGHAGGLA